jgi:hypothetical protein
MHTMIAFPEPLELSSVELGPGPGLETETKNVSTLRGRQIGKRGKLKALFRLGSGFDSGVLHGS